MAYLRFECQIGPRGDLKTSFRTLKFALLWKLDCESAAPTPLGTGPPWGADEV